MDTNKAAYWIALGVLVLGLNSEYRHGSFVGLHRVAEYAGSALCRMATRAEQTLAVARVLVRSERFPVDGLVAATGGAETARAQGELLRDQARDEAELFWDRVRRGNLPALRKITSGSCRASLGLDGRDARPHTSIPLEQPNQLGTVSIRENQL
jgi:hypothetical protein